MLLLYIILLYYHMNIDNLYLQLNKKPSDVSVYSYTRNAQHLCTTYATNKADTTTNTTSTTNITNKPNVSNESNVTSELSVVSSKYLSPHEYNKQHNLTISSKKFRWGILIDI